LTDTISVHYTIITQHDVACLDQYNGLNTLMFFWPCITNWLYINHQLLCTDYYYPCSAETSRKSGVL